MELKLTSVARASLEELRLDYEDFLRQRRLTLWPIDDPRRKALVESRPGDADDVALWAQRCRSMPSMPSMASIPPTFPEIAANGAHALVGVACALLDRQIAFLARAFEKEGGFTERLYRVRNRARKHF